MTCLADVGVKTVEENLFPLPTFSHLFEPCRRVVTSEKVRRGSFGELEVKDTRAAALATSQETSPDKQYV